MTGEDTVSVSFPRQGGEFCSSDGEKKKKGPENKVPGAPELLALVFRQSAPTISKQMRQVGMFSGSVEPSSTGS